MTPEILSELSITEPITGHFFGNRSRTDHGNHRAVAECAWEPITVAITAITGGAITFSPPSLAGVNGRRRDRFGLVSTHGTGRPMAPPRSEVAA